MVRLSYFFALLALTVALASVKAAPIEDDLAEFQLSTRSSPIEGLFESIEKRSSIPRQEFKRQACEFCCVNRPVCKSSSSGSRRGLLDVTFETLKKRSTREELTKRACDLCGHNPGGGGH